MNAERLQHKLVAAARRVPTSDAVPFAFEKRIMHALRNAPAPDAWTTWGRLLWRALAPCCAVMILVGLGTHPRSEPAFDLEETIDAVLLAGLDHGGDWP
ncbi:MAG: hypothetical protein KF833_13625 [Verrucomicrobiae bacterium]|nr:hypothetical protein [Verrucomicrobiae bacterium]